MSRPRSEPKPLDAKKLRRALQRLSDSVLLAVAAMDETLPRRRDIPRDVSTWLGQFAQALDMENDRVRFFALGVDFRKDDKVRVVAKLKARRA